MKKSDIIKLEIYQSFDENLITESEKNDLLYILEKKTKSQYRLDKFKKNHDYDPKTNTIDVNGERIKFKYLGGSNKYNEPIIGKIKRKSTPNEEIQLNRSAFNGKNPQTPEFILNHEKGHSVVHHSRDDFDKDCDMDIAVKKAHDKLHINTDKFANHGKDYDEYLSDYYSINHTKNGSKAMRDTNKQIMKRLNKTDDLSKYPSKRVNELNNSVNASLSNDEKRKLIKNQIQNELKAREKTIKELKNHNEINFLK